MTKPKSPKLTFRNVLASKSITEIELYWNLTIAEVSREARVNGYAASVFLESPYGAKFAEKLINSLYKNNPNSNYNELDIFEILCTIRELIHVWRALPCTAIQRAAGASASMSYLNAAIYYVDE